MCCLSPHQPAVTTPSIYNNLSKDAKVIRDPALLEVPGPHNPSLLIPIGDLNIGTEPAEALDGDPAAVEYLVHPATAVLLAGHGHSLLTPCIPLFAVLLAAEF